MGLKTSIQWCDSTCNPAMGCDGCELHPEHCYAKAWCDHYAGRKGYPKRFEQPELFAGRIQQAKRWPDLTGTDRPDKPWLNGYPRIIFLCDLGDPFAPSLPLVWLDEHVLGIADSPHLWVLLTKWPGRLAEFVAWWTSRHCQSFPGNIWLGTSVTSQESVSRIEDLVRIPCNTRVLSLEPLLGPIDLRLEDCWILEDCYELCERLHGVIVGGESGKHSRRCHVELIRSIRDQCQAVSLPCFVKQIGSRPVEDGTIDETVPWDQSWPEHVRLVPSVMQSYHRGRWVFDVTGLRDPKGGDWDEWPQDLRVRQMPRWEAAQ